MRANELRIGNLIKIGGNTLNTYQTYIPTKVTLAILNEIAGENEERPDAKLSVFMPIPLTEEWLLKFGFNTHDKSEYFKEISSKPIFEYFDLEKCGNIFEHDSCRNVIEYVHQLQNLYFALTGEELE